jgi:hypothetical protein
MFFNNTKTLHPDIQPFGRSLLGVLRRYVQPDYIRLEEPPPLFHQHECFRRDYFQPICDVKLTGAIAFDIKNTRNPDTDGNTESLFLVYLSSRRSLPWCERKG